MICSIILTIYLYCCFAVNEDFDVNTADKLARGILLEGVPEMFLWLIFS